MKNDSLICFRVSRHVQEAMVNVSSEEREALSSIVNVVLSNYLQMREMIKKTDFERRSHTRKAFLTPALIKHFDPRGTKLNTALITDISLGGVQVTILKDARNDMSSAPLTLKFEIVFSLPHDNSPVYMTCEPRRIIDSPNSVRVGAAFTGGESESHKKLQAYLM
ncbi:MAG: PilZ domain-containing protein [Syntrophaceae bacterium]|nr:PilZ domain-containing protein [Syntrophaceae bacterium]